MSFEFCARTHPGRARQNNEDVVLFDQALQIAVLADGMGGYNAGEVASSMAAASVLDDLRRWLAQAGPAPQPDDVHRALEQGVLRANERVYDAARSNPEYSGMGTTLVAAVFFEPGRLVLAHIGDSRCYRLRDGSIRLLTHDHSLLQEQIDAGLITSDQAALSDLRNLVTRALGIEPSVLPEIHGHTVEPGDLYLLCSDGLNDMVDDRRIAAIVGGNAPLSQKADALIREANDSGGRDNVSVVLAQVSGGASSAGTLPPRGLVARLLGM